MSDPSGVSLMLAAAMVLVVLGALLYAARSNARRKKVYKIGGGRYYDRATVAVRYIGRVPGKDGGPNSYAYRVCFRTQIGQIVDLAVPRQLFYSFSAGDTGLLQVQG